MQDEGGVPSRLRPFVTMGFAQNGVSGQEVYGDCIFCGKENKLYINTLTGQFSCKAGHCGLEGNLYTFMQCCWETWKEQEEQTPERLWRKLVEDRGVPQEVLEEAGVVWSADMNLWALPVFNSKGNVVNFRFYKPGQKLRGLPSVDLCLYGMEHAPIAGDPVYLCEGEWDTLCLRHMLSRDGSPGVVYGVPGAAVFKDAWVEVLAGHDLVLCYDNDEDGRRGARRAWEKCHASARSIRSVVWPDEMPEKFDIRDYYNLDGPLEGLQELIQDYNPRVKSEGRSPHSGMVPLKEGSRPSFQKVLATYREWLHMDQALEDALRVVYAVVLSNQIDGDPLWVHVVGPPGSGKTEILMSTSEVPQCVVVSSITAHTLVSGFTLPGGGDPSLLPKLIGNVFVLKDFTEILSMPKVDKENIYSTLRGAYDGHVERPYGHGLVRVYDGYFSMLSGVTSSVFGEQHSSLGERFLMYHLSRDITYDSDAIIRAALGNVGRETAMKQVLAECAKGYLRYAFAPDQIPSIPDRYIDRLVALPQVVAALRAGVEKDGYSGTLAYRPCPEMGTRLGKQFKKLLQALGMLNDPPMVGEAEYKVLVKVALDTCNGFNLDVSRALAEYPNGTDSHTLAEKCEIPHTTLYEQLNDLVSLKVLTRKSIGGHVGRPAAIYELSPVFRAHWDAAGLGSMKLETVARPRIRMRRRLRATRINPDL